MLEKKFNAEELYILHISETIYYVPYGEEGMSYNDSYTREYYTVASTKDGKTFKDAFKLRKYKKDGFVGCGVMRDIEEMVPLNSYAPITGQIYRSRVAQIFNSFIDELLLDINEDIKDMELETKKLELKG